MSESKPMSIPEVKKLLKRNKKKAVLQTIENCLIVLRNDPTLQGAIRQNILTDRQDIVKDVGWVRSSTSITDTDYQYIMHYLEHNYSLSLEKKIQAAVKIIANENQFHPIRDYLSALRWDGEERLPYVLSKYLGAEPCAYTTEVLKVFMLGAVSRVFQPGIKFDYMLCLAGGQGAGKSKQIEGLMPVSTLQWDALSAISKTCWTPEIAQLRIDLLDNNFSGLQTFVSALNAPHIEAANIALLKSAQIFNSLSLPRGLTSAVKEMHAPTAERLLHADNISYDASSKTFYVEENPSASATISETNIICSGLQLLAGLDESDLIEFLNHLSEYPNLALNHPVGQKISEIIASWDSIIDFDCSEYFHARSLPEGRCPYTHAELGQAPNGVTWHGRYNFVGESHYYFSNKVKGAILEVKKHTKDPRVQIATVVPRKSVKMIDLSGDGTRNKFLEYCRFAPDTNNYSNIKREYLIPCFVANCCKYHGIEGIKYYGSKEYMNYVVWNDAFFECIRSEIQDL